MTTTAVFAEIIVVGLQAEIWLAILVLAIFGADWVDIGAVDEWATLLTLLVLAAASQDRLAEGGRERRYVDEHARVLRSAVEQLTGPR